MLHLFICSSSADPAPALDGEPRGTLNASSVAASAAANSGSSSSACKQNISAMLQIKSAPLVARTSGAAVTVENWARVHQPGTYELKCRLVSVVDGRNQVAGRQSWPWACYWQPIDRQLWLRSEMASIRQSRRQCHPALLRHEQVPEPVCGTADGSASGRKAARRRQRRSPPGQLKWRRHYTAAVLQLLTTYECATFNRNSAAPRQCRQQCRPGRLKLRRQCAAAASPLCRHPPGGSRG